MTDKRKPHLGGDGQARHTGDEPRGGRVIRGSRVRVVHRKERKRAKFGCYPLIIRHLSQKRLVQYTDFLVQYTDFLDYFIEPNGVKSAQMVQ